MQKLKNLTLMKDLLRDDHSEGELTMLCPRPCNQKKFKQQRNELQAGLAKCAAMFGKQTENQRDRDFQDASRPKEPGEELL